jgi:diphosphomevalonate decarboxylase
MKATAQAPSNIAFIKYWGRKDEVLRLPENGSISMNLSGLTTTTTVEFLDSLENDQVIINGTSDLKESKRVSVHLDRIRHLAKISLKAKVVSVNSFPASRGLSSSASGFAALTVAGVTAAGLHLSEPELSIVARQGSGSSCRSIPNGFVEWLDGDTSESSYAYSLYPEDYWKLCDVVVITGTEKKEVSTSEGMTTFGSSPFSSVRVQGISKKIDIIKQALKHKNFELLGVTSEQEALEMHAVMITSTPPLLYWTTQTLAFMKKIFMWRKQGLQVYFSLNTGQDLHILCEEKTVPLLQEKLQQEEGILDIIINYPAKGTKIIDNHLF